MMKVLCGTGGGGGGGILLILIWLWVKTHFRTYLGGNWDVHWGYDLDFDPWSFGNHSLASDPFEVLRVNFKGSRATSVLVKNNFGQTVTVQAKTLCLNHFLPNAFSNQTTKS